MGARFVFLPTRSVSETVVQCESMFKFPNPAKSLTPLLSFKKCVESHY